MGNNLLSPSQLSSYATPQAPVAQNPAPQNNGGLLTPSQLSSYANKSNPSSPTSNVGSSWDSYYKSIQPQTQGVPKTDPNHTPNIGDELNKYGTPNLGGSDVGRDVADSLQKHSQNIADDYNSLKNTPENSNERTLGSLSFLGHAAGNVAGTVGDMFGSVLSHVVPQSIKNGFGDYINFVGDKLNQIPGMTDKLSVINGVMDKNPDLAKSISDVFNTVSLMGGEKGEPTLKQGLNNTLNEGKNIASDVKTGVVDPALEKVKGVLPDKSGNSPLNEKTITDNYNRSIKPSITGKSSAAQIAQANDRVVTGVKSIVQNKAGLEFTDAEGNSIKGQSPKTVQQTSEAIQQTKASIFKQYDALAKQAGQKGITVDAPSIAKELQPVIESKSLNITNPETVAYAKQLQQRLTEQGAIDAQTAQEVIKNYNDELKTYYRNPTPGAASRVQVDAMIANKFRDNLDEGITEMTGTQYQDLKNQYGALSSMEKDVARRAATMAKQSKVGLVGNLSNIASGAELVRGLMTGNPVDMAIGGTIKGIELYNKYLNNPDVGIQKMFNEVEKSSPSPTGSTPPAGAQEIKGNASPKPTTFEAKSKVGQMIQDAGKNGTQKGSVTIGGKSVNVHPDDLGIMKDFTDYAAGDYKPTGKDAYELELDASRIADKYGIKTFKTNKGLANEFGRILDTNTQ